jgi:hypothetical protein
VDSDLAYADLIQVVGFQDVETTDVTIEYRKP